MKNKIRKAIFPVAGLGTRFLPATKCVPKEMLTVLDRPIIEWSVIEAFKSGIEQIIFVTSSKKNILSEHFDKSKLLEDLLKKKKKKKELDAIRYQTTLGELVSVMQVEPKGLGHAVWCARNLIQNEKFCVILPDDIILSKKPVIKQILDLEKKVGGSIINMSSQMGHVGGPIRSVYNMNKWGLECLTKGMALDLAKYNIRVNSVCPNIVLTPRTKKYFADKKYNKYVKENTPINKVVTVSDVATSITFLASSAAAMITGTSIIIDGGWTAK